ncbi:Protein of unknown function [Cotesia congregata]|uniref:Uncharacterized protein n=1 Tax=Cotesia congregata TaxID=51543 RepID=A0A8J2MAJ2_COTCN|nr:Protein of unknown function [Cotesia congregata]
MAEERPQAGQARRTGNLNLLSLYKKLRSELKIKICDARDNYFKNVLEESAQGSDIWSKLKKLGIIKPRQSSPLDHFDANLLNNFYASTVTKYPSCDKNFVFDLPNHHTKQVNCVFNWSKLDIVDLYEAADKLTVDAQSVADWARENDLQLNFNKTKVMILGSKGKLKLLDGFDLPPIIVDGNVIPYVDTTKHLGIELSNNLSWNAHTSQISRKAYAALNSLNILSQSCRKLLVTTTILPIINYCSLVLLDLSKGLDIKLQRILNSTIRFIFNLKRDEHITPYRQDLRWLSIRMHGIYSLACYFYKLLQTGEPKYLRKLFCDEDESVRRSDRLAQKNNNIIFRIPNFHHSVVFETLIRSVSHTPMAGTSAGCHRLFINREF